MKTFQFPKWKSAPLCLVMLTLLLSSTISVSATTFYISPSGNDATGTGTAANPWRTLYKATATVAGNGDIIHVNAGTYIETLQCLLKPGVSIEGDGVTSVLKSTLTADWQAMLVASSPEGTNGNQHISNVKFDGQNLATFWGIYIGGRSNVSMYNCTVENFKDRGIIFGGRNDNAEAPPAIYATGNSFHHNIVNNCAAYNTPNGIYGRGCLNIGGQEGMLIYNNTITQNQRPDGFNGWPIKGFNDGWLKGVKIYNNTLNKITFSGNYAGENGWDFCIELFNESGLEIYGNTIQGSIDLNYQFKGSYPYSVYIHDNIIGQPTLNDNYESGIIFEFFTQTAIVENNTINNVSGGILFNTRNLSEVSNITIQKNLFSNLGRSIIGNGNNGVAVGFYTEGTDNANISNVGIYNNTFIAAPGNAPYFGLLINCIAAGSMSNLSVKNNIFQGFYNTWFRAAAANNINTITVNNNNLYNNAQNNAVSFSGTPANYTTAGNTTNNPLFVSATNFQLQGSSTLIDAGVYVGLPFVGTAPDRGYAEVVAAPLPIKLLDLNVTENKGKNLLHWITATEVNSDYFNVERSNNGNNYEVIGKVAASGFSSNEMHYYFTDANPLTGVNYYRLAMIDIDNSKELSKTVTIYSKTSKLIDIVNAQLHTTGRNAVINIASTQNQKANLVLYDANGRILLNEAIVLQKGLNSIDKKMPAVANGVYYFRLFNNEASVTKNVLSN